MQLVRYAISRRVLGLSQVMVECAARRWRDRSITPVPAPPSPPRPAGPGSACSARPAWARPDLGPAGRRGGCALPWLCPSATMAHLPQGPSNSSLCRMSCVGLWKHGPRCSGGILRLGFALRPPAPRTRGVAKPGRDVSRAASRLSMCTSGCVWPSLCTSGCVRPSMCTSGCVRPSMCTSGCVQVGSSCSLSLGL